MSKWRSSCIWYIFHLCRFSLLLDVLEKNTSIFLLKLCYNRLGRDHHKPNASSDNLRYRLRIVTSSKPKLKILLWGNTFEEQWFFSFQILSNIDIYHSYNITYIKVIMIAPRQSKLLLKEYITVTIWQNLC